MTVTPKFIGLDTHYLCADGKRKRRVHLDGAASPLAAQAAVDAINALLPHYSNSHSYVHSSAQISTMAQAWAHDTILGVVSASKEEYTSIFTGSGSTAGINRLARGLAVARPTRKVVIVSAMEHHANDLPHRQFDNQVIYCPLTNQGANMGAVDLEQFASLCAQHSEQLNYVAVSSVSNVTGIKNPIREMAELAHHHNAYLLVDGAQSLAHGPTDVEQMHADFFVFSGHKAYAPMSPGVLVAKKNVLHELKGQDLGGGSVSSVSFYDFELLTQYPDKEQSGTPNIVGAVALAKVLKELQAYGFNTIEEHDQSVMAHLQKRLQTQPGITVYGDTNLSRVGALAFNHQDIDHGLLAAILNDYYAIAVRNECFCAHPYVSSLLREELWQLDLSDIEESEQEYYINRKRGMVRASVSLYNSVQDVDQLIAAIEEIVLKLSEYEKVYIAHPDGSYAHKTFKLDWPAELDL